MSDYSIVLASNNAGKVREFNSLLTGLHFKVLPQSHFQLESVEETGLTFVENAILKARHASQHTGLPALADDSGIEVDALHGAPGVFSARFAGPGANDQANCELLLEKLREVPDGKRSARFRCVLAYLRHAADPMPLICQGTWEGLILHEPRGSNGFGYDPVFYAPPQRCSAAELPPEQKNQLSHRGQALYALREALRQEQPYLEMFYSESLG
jgi:XTP/dITP diphosphohydrolase